jgi:hypothetical protein
MQIGGRLKVRSIVFSALVATGFAFATSAVAFAGNAIESPPTSDATRILGAAVRGENYDVDPVVPSDGFLQIFTVNSKVGRFTVGGRELLNRRIRELGALAALEKMSQSDLFSQSLVKSATSPVKFGFDLLRNPFGTVDQTVSGVTSAFGQIGSGLSNPNADPDGLAASAIGVSSAKRQLAAQLEVDPYSDFKPLTDKLTEVATTMALGGLGPKAAFSLIGGGAGIALSYSSTADSVRDLVRDKTPAQLVELNAQRLRAMGADEKATQAFLGNEFFTIVDHTRIVEALQSLGKVKNRALYVERAAGAHSRDLAFFLVRRAELIADYQRSSGGMIAQFVAAQGFPLNKLADGRVIMIAPIDLLSWSPTPVQALAAITSGLSPTGKSVPVELRITGSATTKARESLKGINWTLTEVRSN